MGDLVNLRRSRKQRERGREAAAAAENRASFGMTKADRRRVEAEREMTKRSLDSHRRDRPDGG